MHSRLESANVGGFLVTSKVSESDDSVALHSYSPRLLLASADTSVVFAGQAETPHTASGERCVAVQQNVFQHFLHSNTVHFNSW